MAEAAAYGAVSTAELGAAVARAERRAAVLETFGNPQATPAEIAWARNWGAEAENAATGTPDLLPHLTK